MHNARKHTLPRAELSCLSFTWHFSLCLISCCVSKRSHERKNFHTFHLLLSSLPFTHSVLSLLIVLVPSARLIDQKGSECSSMFAWLNSGQPEPSCFFCGVFLCFFSPPPHKLPAPSPPLSHTPRLVSSPLSFRCFPHCRSLFYIPLHFNTYTLGNIPDSISHRRKSDIYVARG